ncbi:MAG: hypothetical protein IH968_17550 [Gemmatimonadetes bacterium]|nr:hypothetical protein [Gemmatimonadota bacterium]
MSHRTWTDPRDGKHWLLSLEWWKDRKVLAFASEQETCEVELQSEKHLSDMSDNELMALLDRGRGC